MDQNKRPLVKNASDPQQLKEAQAKKNLRDREEVTDLKFVLSHPQGQRLLWRILGKCGIFTASQHFDPHVVYFNEGKRNLGLEILADINRADQNAIIQMMQRARVPELGDE